MRAVTFNIHHGAEGLDRVSGFLQALVPDICFLQEVDRRCDRSGRVDQATLLAGALGHQFAFAEAMPWEGGSYGIALTARWPLAEVRTVRLPHRSPRQPDGYGEPRVLLVARSGRLLLAGTHLGLDATERLEQAAAIRSELRGAEPLILGGDLNEGPAGPVTSDTWRDWLQDAFRQGGGVETVTGPPDAPPVRIDAVLASRTAPRALRATLGPDGISDHRAVIVDFEEVASG